LVSKKKKKNGRSTNIFFFFWKFPGADPNFPNKRGYTPLHAAAEEGHLEILQLLLSRGGKINIIDDNGRKKKKKNFEKFFFIYLFIFRVHFIAYSGY
jgi:hypothetical protein